MILFPSPFNRVHFSKKDYYYDYCASYFYCLRDVCLIHLDPDSYNLMAYSLTILSTNITNKDDTIQTLFIFFLTARHLHDKNPTHLQRHKTSSIVDMQKNERHQLID